MHSKVVAESKPDKRTTFNWLRILLVIFALPLFLVLGFWQLDRADQKEARVSEYASQPRVLSDAGDAEALLRGRTLVPVTSVVNINDSRYFLLDNRTREGRPGYEVIVPVEVGAGIMLANLGWVAGNPDRRILPTLIIEPGQSMQIEAALGRPENLMQLGSDIEAQTGWPKRIQLIDTPFMSEKLGFLLEPFVLQIQSSTFSEITPHLPTIKSMPPERHIGYAVQWFGLALALIVWLLVSAQFSRREV